jgi:predicted CoA-substrate-specific enzyme activase
MITAGIDVGSKNIQIVVLNGGDVAARVSVASGFDQEDSARQGIEQAAAAAGVQVDAMAVIVATGVGRKAIPFAHHQVTEVAADARGAFMLFPEARTVIDVGADEARAIRIDGSGKVLDFAVNEKCAAGAGAFVEAMSRALEVSLQKFGEISLESTESIPMNAQCTVFAESEVVSLIHANASQKDIARSVHDAMAGRVSAMARRAGLENEVVIAGGVAYNMGFVKALKDTLGVGELHVLSEPEYVGAYGAALIAAERAGEPVTALQRA